MNRLNIDGDRWDPRVLIEAVGKLTNLVVLMEGGATSRTEVISSGDARKVLEERIAELAARRRDG